METDNTETNGLPKVWWLSQLKGKPFSHTTLSAAVKTGKLKAFRSGKKVLVFDTDWRAFLTSFPSAASGPAQAEAAEQAARRNADLAATTQNIRSAVEHGLLPSASKAKAKKGAPVTA
jgi:hypothetical protein